MECLQTEPLEKLIHLNEVLRKLSERIKQEIEETKIYYHSKKSSNKNYSDDFEIEVLVDYILEKNDPLFDEESDNIIFSFEETFTHTSSEKFDERYLKLDYPYPFRNDILKKIKNPCRLLYLLSEKLEISDICRIGELWYDFKFINQKFIAI